MAKCGGHNILHDTDNNGCHTIFVLNECKTQDDIGHTTIGYTVRQKELRISAKIQISNDILDLTIDTGAQISTLKPCKLLHDTEVNCDKKMPIVGIAKDLTIFTLGQVETQIYFNNIPFEHSFQIVQNGFNIPNDGIIGNDFLMKFGATINYERNELILRIPKQCSRSDIESTRDQTIVKLQDATQSRHTLISSRKRNRNKDYFIVILMTQLKIY